MSGRTFTFFKKVLTVRPLSCIMLIAVAASDSKTLEKKLQKVLDNPSRMK